MVMTVVAIGPVHVAGGAVVVIMVMIAIGAVDMRLGLGGCFNGIGHRAACANFSCSMSGHKQSWPGMQMRPKGRSALI